MALPQNQIRPQAQPLSSFLQPTRRNVAGAAGPIEIPRVPQINVIGQGSGGNAPGVNRFAQVAQALAPFNQQLTQLMGAGLQMYAQAEVQKGVNEALRAKALLEEQQAQSGAEYAAENRRLEQADPIAALAMDTVNPYRQAGRQRALAQLAGAEAKSALVDAYRSTPGLELLQPGSPELARFKAGVVTDLAQKYGIDQGSPGFTQFVAPKINEGWDRVTELQWQDRQDYLKSTIPRTASAQILGIFYEAISAGQVEVFSADGRSRIVNVNEGGGAFESAVAARITAVLDGIRNESGLRGQTTQLVRATLENVFAMAEGHGLESLKRIALKAETGPVGPDGRREIAATMFGAEALDAEIKYGELTYKRDQRAQEALSKQYQDDLAQLTYNLPDGPERLTAIEALRAREEYAGLGYAEKLELEQKGSSTIDAVRNLGRSTEAVDQLLQDMDGRYGTAWDPNQADAEFEVALAAAPDDKKDELRRQYAALRRRNNEQKASPTAPQANAVIDRAIKANLKTAYPNSVTEAALRGVSVESVMAGWTDANVAESARRQFSAFQAHVNNRIAEEQGKLGRPLTPAEVTQVASRAVEEYGKSTPSARQYLFPGVGGVPGAQGAPAQPAGAGPQGSGPPPGTKPFTGKTYPSSQLDNAPGRRELLQSWRNQPVLDAQSVVNEGNRILAGQQPSAALQRFAREAGTTPGQLINRHLDFYPGMDMTPQERQRLMRDGRQAQGAASSARAAAPRPSTPGPVARAGGWMLDLLMGTRPAVAAQQRPLPSAVGMGGSQQVAARGGGGGKASGLLALIRSGEGDWNSVNFGTVNNTGRGIGTIVNRSIGSLEAMQSSGQVFAIGAYQFTPGVLARARREAGLSPDAPFSPANQDKMAMALLTGSKRPALAAYLTGRSSDLNAAHWEVAREWAALQAPNGRGVYDGDSAGNRAGISAARVRQMLIQARREISGR
jgi:hypothetical protein